MGWIDFDDKAQKLADIYAKNERKADGVTYFDTDCPHCLKPYKVNQVHYSFSKWGGKCFSCKDEDNGLEAVYNAFNEKWDEDEDEDEKKPVKVVSPKNQYRRKITRLNETRHVPAPALVPALVPAPAPANDVMDTNEMMVIYHESTQRLRELIKNREANNIAIDYLKNGRGLSVSSITNLELDLGLWYDRGYPVLLSFCFSNIDEKWELARVERHYFTRPKTKKVNGKVVKNNTKYPFKGWGGNGFMFGERQALKQAIQAKIDGYPSGLVICEGVYDSLSIWQYNKYFARQGVCLASIATYGTTYEIDLTDKYLTSKFDFIILALDDDSQNEFNAGANFATKWQNLLKEKMRAGLLSCMDYEGEKDVNDFLKKSGYKGLRNALQKIVNQSVIMIHGDLSKTTILF